MPTLNPRITITVTPRVNAALDRICVVTRNSKSSIVGDILDESVPMLMKMIKVMEAAKTLEKDIASNVIAPFVDAQAHIEQQLGLTLDDFSATSEELIREMELISRRMRPTAPKERSVASTTVRSRPHLSPSSNRGGRNQTGQSTKVVKPLILRRKVCE